MNAGIRYYGKISFIEKVRRGDIAEISTNRNKETLYYKFYVKEWKKLQATIKPKELRVSSRIYTNLFLVLNSEYVSELCIKTKEEYRLYMEVKRLVNKAQIHTHEGEDEGRLFDLEFEDGRIYIEDNSIKIYKNKKFYQYKLEDFVVKPRSIISSIRKILNLQE